MSKLDRLHQAYIRDRNMPLWVGYLIISLIGAFIIFFIWFLIYICPSVFLSAMAKYDENHVLRQKTNYSCATCSIYMLLQDENVDVSLFRVGLTAKTMWYGTSTTNIAKAGQKFGFRIDRGMADFDSLMAANAPAIVSYYEHGWPHAVYVRPDQEAGYLIVKNPANGLIFTRREFFSSHFFANEVEAIVFYRR